MRRLVSNAAAVAAIVLAMPAAAEIGHFVPGMVNIRDYLLPPEAGVYLTAYNYFYSTDRRNDKNGDKIDSLVATVNPAGPFLPPVQVPVNVDVDLDLYALATPLIWVSDWDVLGGRFGAFVAPTFANASVDAQLSIGERFGGKADNASFAPGDLVVQPVWLDWGGTHWEASAAYAFYAPVGKYDTETRQLLGNRVKTEDPDNIGYGFWTHQFQAAGAWYPFENKGTAVVGAATYEYHTDKQGFDLQPGEDITLNWGISQYIPLSSDQHLLLEIGPAGWDGWQIHADSGSDAVDHHLDRTHAVGGQLGITYVPWFLVVNFHGFSELETRSRFQGYSLGLNVAKKFW